MNRYIRQINLPEIGLTGQDRLSRAHIVMIGAGGLGAPALPYLAGAGIGAITIIDHDNVDTHNLHRQTIYQTAQSGQSKAQLTGAYLRALNPDITVHVITQRLDANNATQIFAAHNFTLILDGSDNFSTKALLNEISLTLRIPLITASVNQFAGQIGIFKGYESDQACYKCLFPDFPLDARNCNEAGILGTTAGIIGTMQAHITLCHILDIEGFEGGKFYTVDLKSMRIASINAHKDQSCKTCHNHTPINAPQRKGKPAMPDMISIENLNDCPSIIIDVRQPEEIVADPLRNPAIINAPINIPLPELIARLDELPSDKRLAFICAGNFRSRQAADYLAAQGMENICVLDKFSL